MSFDPHAFAEHLASLQRFKQDDNLLYEWTGTHWNVLGDEAAERNAYHWLVANQREYATTRNAASAVGSAKHWVDALGPIADEMVVPCMNGYVKICDGVPSLSDADPAMGLRHVLSCAFDTAEQSSPCFSRFIQQVLPDAEVRARVQEYVGYTLTSDTRYQRAQLWLGSGANGKGVLANIVQALHGRAEAVRLDELDGFGLSALVGASLIYSDEVPQGAIQEQVLKSAIAGERIYIDRKYKEPVSARLRGKWLVLGNHLPLIRDHSTGFWRRWDVVPFNITISEENRDPILAERIIENELGGVLTWALEGLIRLQKRGGFSANVPAAMAELIQEVKAESNAVLAWCEDCSIQKRVGLQTRKSEVYSHFRGWCERNGRRADGDAAFWKKLKAILNLEVDNQRGRVERGGAPVRVCPIDLSGSV
ncbi:DNA primase [Duganella dendranthematis]|uniref:DNA primase n=1 Tax=Duganella dendranthematis TaxID=2728021 RepID=A0ABX6MBH9_9BURK|nr:phage/plasmid primase, P4 family [Duganella dendranthematis]QJD91686.1 DNA primase [Duganella dendranthematis]